MYGLKPVPFKTEGNTEFFRSLYRRKDSASARLQSKDLCAAFVQGLG
jgi:hypothetical protein